MRREAPPQRSVNGSFLRYPPYNLRWLREPAPLLHGAVAPPGLVGFCFDVPIGTGPLDRGCPELGLVASFLEALRRVAPSPDATLALCAGYVAHRLRTGETLPAAPVPPPAIWPADCPWPG